MWLLDAMRQGSARLVTSCEENQVIEEEEGARARRENNGWATKTTTKTVTLNCMRHAQRSCRRTLTPLPLASYLATDLAIRADRKEEAGMESLHQRDGLLI